ncbi:MAG: MBL fold metallo-hydrolase [Acidobacteriota bacterium]
MLREAGLGALTALVLAACGPQAGPAGGDEMTARSVPTVESEAPKGPYVRVLGTAQDGGLPHAACGCDRCDRARSEPAFARHIASLALVLPASDRVMLVDATPDLRQQLDALMDVRDDPPDRVDRDPVDGVLLTHAHIGHYLGLAFFGFEAVHTRDLPVYCTAALGEFLSQHGPWEQLVRLGNLKLVESLPGEPIDLGDGVTAEPRIVPHRDEYSDTVAWILRGPQRSLLYIPDTEPWGRWPVAIEEWLAEVDVALLDGTFYSAAELPGREVSEIGHPLIVDSMERFAGRSRPRILFTHLNHSNPALEPGSPAAEEIRSRGFEVASDGLEFPL